MNINLRFGLLRFITEVCHQPELIELRERNARRLAALKATHSLTENERTRASQSTPSRLDAYNCLQSCPSSAFGGIGVGNAFAVVDRFRASDQ